MSTSSKLVQLLVVAGALGVVTACGTDRNAGDAGTAADTNAQKAEAPKEKYPEPRWPSYFQPPKTVEDLMPSARALVRNQSGFQGKGMGILQPGDSVLIVASNGSDPMVLEAIRRALEERKVTPHIKFNYELLGQRREDVERQDRRNQRGRQINKAGIYQASQWITGQFANPEEPKAWLKQRRPDIYAELFPEESASALRPSTSSGRPEPVEGREPQGAPSASRGGPTGTTGTQAAQPRRAGAERGVGVPASDRAWRGAGAPAIQEKRPRGEGGEEPSEESGAGSQNAQRGRAGMGEAIKKYLKAHPELKGVFWGGGGTTGLRRALYPMQDKYLGTFITDNIYNLQSQMSSYPGDVWQLAEEQVLEPLAYVDRIEMTDPEGTNLWSNITEEMAQRWTQGSYQRGHLYMFPNQATGRFGYSFVNYPAFQQKWLAREPIARIDGVLAGTQGHGGFFPRWEVTFKDGFIVDVTGGGAQGEALKEFLTYKNLNTIVYPYHKTPGYWYLYEIAFGSHPKAFRHPQPLLQSGNTSPERARSGVIHWGLGSRLWHDPDAPTESKTWADFTAKHNLPYDHGFHTHTYFTTYKVRLRNATKWVNILEKGRMTSLDHPEVRALASRYGDPNYLLAEDWIPEVPGINAPGDYMRDYAPDPGGYSLKVLDKAMKGIYEHYFPAAGNRLTSTPSAPGSATGSKAGGAGSR